MYVSVGCVYVPVLGVCMFCFNRAVLVIVLTCMHFLRPGSDTMLCFNFNPFYNPPSLHKSMPTLYVVVFICLLVCVSLCCVCEARLLYISGLVHVLHVHLL